jgi:hypothetical protein
VQGLHQIDWLTGGQIQRPAGQATIHRDGRSGKIQTGRVLEGVMLEETATMEDGDEVGETTEKKREEREQRKRVDERAEAER